MILPRVIPTLLLRGAGLVKTTRFENAVYLGDPVNAVRIFNDKEVDELMLLDVDATRENRAPNFRLVAEVASECFMPLGYGGGVRTLNQVAELLEIGVEKIVLNTAAVEQPELVRAATERFGSSTIVVSMDVKRRRFRGNRVMTRSGRTDARAGPVEHALRMEALGVGELLLTSIDREGTMKGYDLELVRGVSSAVGIPLIAAGGAGSVEDLRRVVMDAGASAAAAGSLFVFQGSHRGILISFPSRRDLERAFAGHRVGLPET